MDTKTVLLFLGAVTFLSGCDASEEHKLIEDLLVKYKKANIQRARPVKVYNTTLKVDFGLALIKTEVDKEKKTVNADAWLRYSWKDEFLTWDPSKYDGISFVKVAPSDIWAPDIVIYNGFGNMDVDDSLMAVISSDGSVLRIPQARLSIDCVENDNGSLSCPMKFGSWTHDGYKLDVDFYNSASEIDITNYFQTNTWEVLAHGAVKETIYYPCCEEPYPHLLFHLTLAEKKEKGWWSG